MKRVAKVLACSNKPKTSSPDASDQDNSEDNDNNNNKDEDNAETSNTDNNEDAKKKAEDKPSTSNAGGESSSRRAVLEQKLTSQELQGGQKPTSSTAGGASSSRAVLTFTYKELQKATDNFRFLNFKGEGSFGRVYGGKLPINHNKLKRVAIKKLRDVTEEAQRQFDAEVSLLGRADHPNVVKLIGYCAEGDHHRLLVYEYMPLGSLDTHLQRGPRRDTLDWNRRKKIAAQAAMGLQYLHQGLKLPVIYGDVKSSNILLGLRYATKLTDFGLAREGPVFTHDANSTVMGTDGYCDPGYVETGVLTLKSDIYSFGVALLELFTGRRPILVLTPATCVNLAEWAAALFHDKTLLTQIADPLLQDQYPASEMHEALTIAMSCVQPEAEKRPNAAALVESLTSLRMQKPDLEGHPKHRRTFSLPPRIFSTHPRHKKPVTEDPRDKGKQPVTEDLRYKQPPGQCPEAIDHISALPDVLLSLILSHLPTKLAVKTSTLSKRWKQVHLLCQEALDNSEDTVFNRYHEALLREFPFNLRRVRLVLRVNEVQGYFEDLVRHANIQQMHLDSRHTCYPFIDSDLCQFPSNLILVELKFLRELHLHGFQFEPVSGTFLNLRTLVLKCVTFPSAISFQQLLESCHALVELWVERCCGFESAITIASNSLRRLDIINVVSIANGNIHITIKAPELLIINLDDDTDFYTVDPSPIHLIKATVNLVNPSYVISEESIKHSNKLLQALKGVQELHLKNRHIFSCGILPTFQNISHLKLKSWDGFPQLFQAMPNLKFLTVEDWKQVIEVSKITSSSDTAIGEEACN